MSWWIPMALGMGSSIVQGVSAASQNRSQQRMNRYNAQMQFNTDVGNIEAQSAIAGFNAAGQLMAGRATAMLGIMEGQLSANRIRMITAYNNNLIFQTALYNDTLLEEDLSLVWEGMDLDLLLLENQRAVERGQIEGVQAASGVVMGQDSAEDVIVDQMTQEELDAFIVRRNADIQAQQIGDARAKGLWEAQVSIMQNHFVGELDATTTMTNARLRAAGTMLNAGIGAMSTLATDAISRRAGMASAYNRRAAGMYGADVQYSQNRTAIQSNFVTSMFGAASKGYEIWKANQNPVVNYPNAVSSASRSASQLARQGSPAWERVLQGAMTREGTSLML